MQEEQPRVPKLKLWAKILFVIFCVGEAILLSYSVWLVDVRFIHHFTENIVQIYGYGVPGGQFWLVIPFQTDLMPYILIGVIWLLITLAWPRIIQFTKDKKLIWNALCWAKFILYTFISFAFVIVCINVLFEQGALLLLTVNLIITAMVFVIPSLSWWQIYPPRSQQWISKLIYK